MYFHQDGGFSNSDVESVEFGGEVSAQLAVTTDDEKTDSETQVRPGKKWS